MAGKRKGRSKGRRARGLSKIQMLHEGGVPSNGRKQRSDARKPPASALAQNTPHQPGLITNWTVGAMNAALNAHEAGQLQLSAQMGTAMGRDDRITAVVETRTSGLLSLPFDVKPAEDQDAETDEEGKVIETDETRAAEEMAQLVSKHWEHIAPPDEVALALHWYILMGVVPIQILWYTVDGAWVPSMKVWDPQYLFWYEDERVFRIQTREQGQIDVVTANGFFLLTKGDRGWMQGAVRSISMHWLSRQWVLRDWNRFNERHGLPIVKALVPSQSEETEKKKFVADVRAMNASGIAMLPQGVGGEEIGYDLELLEPKDRSYDSFDKLEKVLNKNIAVRILGQNLTTDVESGSLAAAKVHDTIRLDRLQSDEVLVSDAIRQHMLVPMVRFNAGLPASMAPSPHWVTEPPEDLVAKSEGLLKLGEALAALRKGGYEPDEESIKQLSHLYGVELVEFEPPEAEIETGDALGAKPPAADDDDDDDDDDDPKQKPAAKAKAA